MAEFHFLRPYWLLALLPALTLCWFLLRRQREATTWEKEIDPQLLKHLLVGEKHRHWFRPLHVLPVCLLLVTMAMAGPTYQREPTPFLDDQAGLMILLKVSKTMLASDVQPSRLIRAKQKIRDLMKIREGAATGLIVYSGSAHLLMPLTRDDRIINSMLEDIGPELMPVDGDNLNQALELSDHLLQKSGLPASLLVIADSVSAAQGTTTQEHALKLPVQFLSMLHPSATVDPGLQKKADALKASVVQLSVDPSDVERINGSAKRKFASVSLSDQGSRWHDSGYALLPFIAMTALFWFRKGWIIR